MAEERHLERPETGDGRLGWNLRTLVGAVVSVAWLVSVLACVFIREFEIPVPVSAAMAALIGYLFRSEVLARLEKKSD